MGLGSRIKKLRINNGLTQDQLAEMLSISRQSVSKWEMDQALPEIDKVIMMSKLFSVGTDEILLEDEEIKKSQTTGNTFGFNLSDCKRF